MVAKTKLSLASLYQLDEVAWLDAMAALVAERRLEDLDLLHLQEYLEDMANRDRREVKNRLVGLAAHVLKWLHQPKKRSRSWRGTIVEQRRQLKDMLKSGTLRNHAESILGEAYDDAVEQAVADTGMSEEAFPSECPWTLEQLLSAEVLNHGG